MVHNFVLCLDGNTLTRSSGSESLRHGDVGKRQREIFDILVGCWRSCIEAGDGSDLDLLENDNEVPQRPFIADVIIANP